MILFITIIVVATPQVFCGLYPRDTETRSTVSLNGLWDFTTNVTDNVTEGFQKAGLNYEDLQLMVVPTSYNEITTNWNLRELAGKVYYQRRFFVPSSWKGQRIWIRFGSVCQSGDVFVNGKFVIYHEIGHLPFDGELTNIVNFGQENLIVVIVDNTLTSTSIPRGKTERLSNGRVKLTYSFDFFHYAGIDRPVTLYTTPQTFIEDLTVNTDINGTSGLIDFSLKLNGSSQGLHVEAYLRDRENRIVSQSNGTLDTNVTIVVPNATFWWPYQMSENPAYLYKLQVEVRDTSRTLVDTYKLPVGIRKLSWSNNSFLINNRSVYIRGVNKHEDADVRGKGLDLALQVRDYNLLRWLGANAYRTSHYPYADEIMDLADEAGIMIIDECPAVHMEEWSDELLANHKESLRQTIARDKNHPSVIMWSVANEANTQEEESEDYFREVFAYGRPLDRTRPFTIVNNQPADTDHAGQFADIIGYNYYMGWYKNLGDLDTIVPKLPQLIKAWNDKHNKPVYISEYGSETLIGYHSLPNSIWSEEYQQNLLSNHFQVYDQLRNDTDWFIGEMIWNFADFRTKQGVKRLGGNRKGLFTRQREPKSSAFLVKERYWNLAKVLDNSTIPQDLRPYVFAMHHNEL